MNIVDIGIIIVILLYTATGFKRGVVKSLVSMVGLIIISMFAYALKDPVADWLMGFMPFFDFGGAYAGAFAINVLIYKTLAFIVVFVILSCILNILTAIAGLVDFLLKVTIILAIPDKLLGSVVGFIEGVLACFLVLFVLSQFPATQKYVFESKYGDRILNRTPILNAVNAAYTQISEEVYVLIDEYKNSDNMEEFNIKISQLFLKYNIVDLDILNTIKDKMGINKNVSFSLGVQ